VIIWKGKTHNLGWEDDKYWQPIFQTRVNVALAKLVPVKFPDVIPDMIMKVIGVFFSLFCKI